MVLTLKESSFVLESPSLTDEESRPEGVSNVIDPLEPVAIFLHTVKYLTRSEGTRASIPAHKKSNGILIIAIFLVLPEKQARFIRNFKLLKIYGPGLKGLGLNVVFMKQDLTDAV